MPALTIREHPRRTLERWDSGEVTQTANTPKDRVASFISSSFLDSDHHAMDPVLSCIPSSHLRSSDDPPGIHSKDKKMSETFQQEKPRVLHLFTWKCLFMF